LVDNYSDQSTIGAGGPIKPLWLNGLAEWLPEEFYWTMGCSYKGQNEGKHFVRSTFGSNMSFRKEAFEKVGNFNVNFGIVNNVMRTGEETEFSIRLHNTITGSKIVYDPNAIVFHKIFDFRKSPQFIIRRCFYYGYAIAKIGSLKTKIDSKFEPTENGFISYLLHNSFKNRIIYCVKGVNIVNNLIQFFALGMFSISVFFGFIVGTISSIIGDR